MKNIEEHIASKQAVVEFYRSKFKSPLVIGLFFYVGIAELILPIGSRAEISFIEQLAINAAFMGAIYFLNFFAAAELIWQGLRKNIPFAWIIFGFMGVVIALLKILLVTYINRQVGLSLIVQETVEVLVLVAMAIFAGITAFRSEILKNLAVDPTIFPIWWPANTSEDLLQRSLPPCAKGRVLRVLSTSQYIQVVTENGQAELRMSLKEAIANIGQDKGIRIHRSTWLANTEIAEVLYKNGNPHVKTLDGDIFNLSREKVSLVKSMLS